MARTAGKLGKKAPDHARPALTFSTLLEAGLPAAPSTADYISEVQGWPMYLNDKIGDCTFAAVGHAIEAFTQYGKGAVVIVPDDAVEKGYEVVGGYDPSKVDPRTGENPTDQGCVLQDVLDYWRKTGVSGDKILFFAKVNPKNDAEVAAAIYNFGHVIYGIEFPNSAMDQFNAGQPWDVVDNDGGIDGGHAFTVGFYKNGSNYNAITWGAVQGVSPAFFDKYADEAWVIATTDWLSDAGAAPTGLDAEALNAAFTALTGEAGPFPVGPEPTPEPTPTPEPVPTPTPVPEPPAPTPGPVTDDADAQLAPVLEKLTHHRWVSNHAQDAIEQWLTAKGYC